MKRVDSRWNHAILVCGKCSRRAGKAFGDAPARSLPKALQRQDGFGRKRKASVGVVETRCLGICPKNAVIVVDTRRPDHWYAIPTGASLDDLAEMLGPDGGPK